MQRPIKFRTWKGSTKRMYFFGGFGVCTNSPKTELRASLYDPSKPMDDYNQVYDSDADDDYDEVPVLMQYTGLKDKNGVEIYEGDILLYLPRKLFVDSEQTRRYGKVYWKEKDACFGLLTFRIDDRAANYDEPFPMSGIEKHEVIGNIYENPELLASK